MLTRHRFLQICGGAIAGPLLGTGGAAWAQAIPAGALNVRDFGARGDGVANDSPGINAALQAAQAKGNGGTVFLPAGRYVLRGVTQARPRPIHTRVEDGIDLTRVAPQVRAHVFLTGLSRLSLIGERGTVLVLRDATACGIYLERCTDVVVRDIGLDFEPLPFSQGTVVAVDAANRTFDWKVDTGYLEPPQGYLALAFEPVGDTSRGLGTGSVFQADGSLKSSAGSSGDLPLERMQERGGGIYRTVSVTPLGALALGDRFAWAARPPNGGSAVALSLSGRCRMENVTVHSSPATAFVANDCEAITFRGCVVERPAGSDRLFAANGGAVLVKGNLGGPIIERCRFQHVGDDAVNITQTGQRLLAVVSPTELIVDFDASQLFREGNRIAVLSQANGRTRGDARVREAALVRFRDGRLARRLVLDRAVNGLVAVDDLGLPEIPPLAEGRDRTTPLAKRPDIVADVDLLGSGFVVRDTTFANHRASGIRTCASDGTIENCRFTNLAGHGVQIGMDLSWPEVYHPQRLTLRRNTFTGIANGANVWLRTLLGNAEQAEGLANQNVTIEDNTFTGFGARAGGIANAAVTVSNGQDVRIRGNTFGAPDPAQTPAPRAVRVDFARDVVVENNAAVQRDRTIDPFQVTARADRATVRVQRNRLTR